MFTGRTSVSKLSGQFLRGRKCNFCGSFKLVHMSRGYVKCSRCGKSKSLRRLRREIRILQGFYHWQPAYQLSQDLGVDVKVITRVYQRMREALYYLAELKAGKLKGEIELDEAYFRGRRKGTRRTAAGKSVVFGLPERDGHVYTKVVGSVSAEELMHHIQSKTRKGSVYFTDAFRGYQSLERYGKHHNPRRENVFKRFLQIYFGCISLYLPKSTTVRLFVSHQQKFVGRYTSSLFSISR